MALIGNPQDFDRIRQRYESLVYPRSGSRRTSSLAEDRFNQLATQGMLSQNIDPMTGLPVSAQTNVGLGSQVISQDATSPGEGVQFKVNPITGATETIIPEYMGGFRQDETDFFPGGGYQTGYDVGDSMIDPATGMPRGILGTGQTGTGIPLTQPRTGGGDGRDDRGIASDTRSLSQKVNDVYGPYAGIKQYGLGLLNPVAGLFSTVSAYNTKKELEEKYGIGTQKEGSQYADVYNQSIGGGASPEQAAIDAALQGGGTYNDAVFNEAGIPELSINDLLADFQSDGGGATQGGTTGFSGGYTEEDANRESFRGRMDGRGDGNQGGGATGSGGGVGGQGMRGGAPGARG